MVRISLTPVDFTSHAEMEEGVVLLSFRNLGSFRQKKSSKSVSRTKTKNIFQLKSLATLFNKLLPTRKLKTEKAPSHTVFYCKEVEEKKHKFESEIERFHRDFILPLENWEAAASETSSDPGRQSDGKFSSASTSDFDSGHFSGDLESGSFSSSVSTISSVSDRKSVSLVECR